MRLMEHEQSCLDSLAHHPDGAAPECSHAVLDELVVRGLLTRHALVPLPGMAQHFLYRLTDAGRVALNSVR